MPAQDAGDVPDNWLFDLGMVPTCLATIGERDDFEREFLATQQAELAVAHQINRRRPNAREGTGRHQCPPNLAPLLIGDADRLHGRLP